MQNAHHEFVYGRQPVLELLRAGRRKVHTLVVKRTAKPAPELQELVDLARDASIPVGWVDERALDERTDGGHHQGVAAESDPYPYVDFAELCVSLRDLQEAPLVLLLDHIQDPQNL